MREVVAVGVLKWQRQPEIVLQKLLLKLADMRSKLSRRFDAVFPAESGGGTDSLSAYRVAAEYPRRGKPELCRRDVASGHKQVLNVL